MNGSISENLQIITEKIRVAEKKSCRTENTVKLLAVSKFHPKEAVIEAIKANQFLFGENRVQEALQKFPEILNSKILNSNNQIELHLIGSLQRNKVKQILPSATCIQSVDRIELVEEIIKQKAKLEFNKPLKIMFEFHTAEDSKSGFTSVDQIKQSIDKILLQPELQIQPIGFMTMAPLTTDEGLIRKSFRTLYELQQKLQSEYKNLSLTELSMGMSSDFELAIEEGSTMVRVGTAIFGERDYAKN